MLPAEFICYDSYQGSLCPGWRGEKAQGMSLSKVFLIGLMKVCRQDGKNTQENSRGKGSYEIMEEMVK